MMIEACIHFAAVKARPQFGLTVFVALVLCLGGGAARAQAGSPACGSLQNHYGPYDYRTDKQKLPIVDGAHFTAPVEAVIRGSTTSSGPGSDLNYTLAAFPNHHRALMSVMRYGEKLKWAPPKDMPWSVECYFDRALRFRPDDGVARMIYASFLSKTKRDAEAAKQLEIVAAAAQDNAFTYYNVGLIYFELKNYEKSLVNAHKAYGLGFGSPELRDQLKGAGKWVEPELPAVQPEKPVGVDEKR